MGVSDGHLAGMGRAAKVLVGRLRSSIFLAVVVATIPSFKGPADETGLPYRTLFDFYLLGPAPKLQNELCAQLAPAYRWPSPI